MTIDEFWELIKKSREGVIDCEEQAKVLTQLLLQLPPTNIHEFAQHFANCRKLTNRNDLWAVAYIINGGCSESGFEDFRGWLVSQGKEFFEQVLIHPECAGDRVEVNRSGNPVRDAECEPILYSAFAAYRQKTGAEMPEVEYDYFAKPQGADWNEDDLKSLYPSLYQRFHLG